MLEAVLLVGGQGSRLRPLTVTTPKPMLPVAGVPCTEHQIARAREAGVTRVILGTSYRAEVFTEHFGDGSRFGVELVYATEDVPLGTGGAIRHVAEHCSPAPTTRCWCSTATCCPGTTSPGRSHDGGPTPRTSRCT